MTQIDSENKLIGRCFLPINQNQTFANFISKESSKRLYDAAQDFLKESNPNSSVLVIKGDTGSGKAHILHAICGEKQKRDPNANVVFLQCDIATTADLEEVLQKHKGIDLLVINNFEKVPEKTESHAKLAQIINLFLTVHKPIVIAASNGISSIKNELSVELRDSLINRFSHNIIPPSVEDRKDFLIKKVNDCGKIIGLEAVEKFAKETENEKAAVLQGLGNDLVSMVLKGEEITIEHVNEVLQMHEKNKNTLDFTESSDSTKLSQVLLKANILEPLERIYKYTFDYYPKCESSNYKFILDKAKNIKEENDDEASIYFFYGGTSYDRSILLNAIWNFISEGKKIIAQKFSHMDMDINEYEKKELLGEIEKYKDTDILILDDFQQVSGLKNIQRVLLTIFTFMRKRNRKIIIMSLNSINEINLFNYTDLKDGLGHAITGEIPLTNKDDRLYILQEQLQEKSVDLSAIEQLWFEGTQGKFLKKVKDMAKQFDTLMEQNPKRLLEEVMREALEFKPPPSNVSERQHSVNHMEKIENTKLNKLSDPRLHSTNADSATLLKFEIFKLSAVSTIFDAIYLHSKIPSKVLKKSDNKNDEKEKRKKFKKDNLIMARKVAVFLAKLGKRADGKQMNNSDVAEYLGIDNSTVSDHYKQVKKMCDSKDSIYVEYIAKVGHFLKKEKEEPGYLKGTIKKLIEEAKARKNLSSKI